MLKRTSLIASAVVAALAMTNTSRAAEISVENAWIRSAPPSATVLAGYMTLHNHSGKAVTLTSVTSPAFESVELHRTTLHGGMMHMEPVKTLVIDGKGMVKLEPNGYHLMLNNPKQKIKNGDAIQFTLNFNGEAQPVNVVVKDGSDETGGASQMEHHHHH